MYFDSVYLKRPSDTVTKYTIYPLSYWWKDCSNGLGSYFATLSNFLQLQLAKPGSKMSCVLLFETEYSLEFVSTNPPFLSCPSDAQIQTAIIWCQLQQKPQKFENVHQWISTFRYANLKIVPLTACESFNRNLSIVHQTLFFKFRNSPFSEKILCGIIV